MNQEKHLYSVLIVSGSEKGLDFITSILPMELFYPTVSLTNASEAKRLLVAQEFDIVIVNTPLRDELGTEFAIETSENGYSAVMMMVKSEAFEQVAYQVEDYGIMCVPKPLSKDRMLQTLRLMTATRSRLLRAKKEKATLQSKMEEIRVVNRAKWVLIEQLKLSEAQAHRYIEKQAMDRCVTRRVVAEDILKTYEI